MHAASLRSAATHITKRTPAWLLLPGFDWAKLSIVEDYACRLCALEHDEITESAAN